MKFSPAPDTSLPPLPDQARTRQSWRAIVLEYMKTPDQADPDHPRFKSFDAMLATTGWKPAGWSLGKRQQNRPHGPFNTVWLHHEPTAYGKPALRPQDSPKAINRRLAAAKAEEYARDNPDQTEAHMSRDNRDEAARLTGSRAKAEAKAKAKAKPGPTLPARPKLFRHKDGSYGPAKPKQPKKPVGRPRKEKVPKPAKISHWAVLMAKKQAEAQAATEKAANDLLNLASDLPADQQEPPIEV